MPSVHLRSTLAAVALANLVAGCGGHTSHYSAEKFRACLLAHHVQAFQSRGPRSSQVVLVWTPSFAEWFYFFPNKAAAASEQARLRAGTTASEKSLTRLLKIQKDNVLVLAPASTDWQSAAHLCL